MATQKFFIDKVYKIYRIRDEVGSSYSNDTPNSNLEFVSCHNNEKDAEDALIELDNFVSYTILPVYSKQIEWS